MKVLERDVLGVTVPLQTCVSVPLACESTVHAMDKLFNNGHFEGILLVDVSNAFNALNMKAALHNVPWIPHQLRKCF